MIENPRKDQWKAHKADTKYIDKISIKNYGANYKDLPWMKRRKVRNIINDEKEGFLKNI